MIAIPEGNTVPVACKADLSSSDGKLLLKQNNVYFRTLLSNGTASSASILWGDWRELVEICFENREADIGRFLRRHLGSASIASLLSTVSEQTKAGPNLVLSTVVEQIKAGPKLSERTFTALAEGERRLKSMLVEEGAEEQRTTTQQLGSWSVAAVFDPPREAASDQTFLNTVSAANPQLTGWPVWLDSRNFHERTARPRMKDRVWQTLVSSLGRGWGSHLDFQTMDARGVFYLWRALQDDLTDKVEPRTKLDPMLMTYRIAETVVVALSFARALEQPEDSSVGLAFKWQKLKGREMDVWADRMTYFSPGRQAYDDEVTSYIELPINTPLSATAPAVEQAIAPLMLAFDGFVMPKKTVEHQVNKLLSRS